MSTLERFFDAVFGIIFPYAIFIAICYFAAHVLIAAERGLLFAN